MKPQLVGETDSHYVMSDGASPFRVPKNGLSDEMHAKIRGFAPKMAGGGLLGGTRGSFESDAEYAARFAPAALPPLGEMGGQDVLPSGEVVTRVAPAAPVARPDAGWVDAGEGLPGLGRPVAPTGPGLLTRDSTARGAPSEADRLAQEHGGLADEGSAPRPAPESKPQSQPRPVAGARVDAPHDYYADSLGAEKERTQALYSQNDVVAATQADLAAKLQQNAIQQNEIHARAAEQSESSMQEIQKARDGIKNLDMSIDPGRFWASAGTPGKIAGVIGLVLGALGAGPDGVNRAAGIIQQSIDRDLDAQKTEHELRMRQGQSALESATSLYSMHRQMGLDDIAANSAARGTALDLAKTQVDLAAAKTANPQAKASLDALAAKFGQEKQAADAATKQRQFDNGIKTMDAQTRRMEMGRSTGVTAQAQQAIVMGVEQENRTIQQSGERLKQLIKQYGTSGGLTGPGAAEMRQLADNMATAAAKLKDPTSVARASEVEAELKNLFKPGFLQREDTAIATVDSYLRNAQSRRDDAFRVRGVDPASSPGRQDGQDSAKALAWANANPGDPRAAAIRRKLGIQ